MKHTGTQPSTEDRLRWLVYELLDAHADTVDIGYDLAGELRWAAHFDYLRALQRRSKEILAASQPPTESIAPN